MENEQKGMHFIADCYIPTQTIASVNSESLIGHPHFRMSYLCF